MPRTLVASIIAVLLVASAQGSIIGVNGPVSSMGVAPTVIAPPSSVLDDLPTVNGMRGFNEAQGVLTTVAHGIDNGSIAAGTLVNSHMILMNNAGDDLLTHFGVVWTFDTPIIGVMSDYWGAYEAMSSFELGYPGTNYTVPSTVGGRVAPFAMRGMESRDSYSILNPFQLQVGMSVREPGDWIRVVTAVSVPEPGSWSDFTVLIAVIGGVGFIRSRRESSQASY